MSKSELYSPRVLATGYAKWFVALRDVFISKVCEKMKLECRFTSFKTSAIPSVSAQRERFKT